MNLSVAREMEEAGATSRVIDRVRTLASGKLPEGVALVAKQCILDWFAVALAGSDEPLVRILIAQALEDGSNPVATVVKQSKKFSGRQAALLNGAMGHALDYDDVNILGHGHITAAILPALLATAEMEGASGERLLRAFIGGYEGAVMIGRFVGRAHYERGFHATVTVGSYGAAAASSTLMGVDAEVAARALGIAGTQAAGLKAQFGTMCKPFHAGKSNENGLVGALLARRGFTSRPDILECPQGFAATQSPSADLEAAFDAPRGGAHILSNLFKYSAACYGTHGAIVAAGNLRRKHGLKQEMIRRVDVNVEPGADRMCNIAVPQTGLEAKFSLRFNTALALAGEDTSSTALYNDTITQRADLCALRDRVNVRCMPANWSHSMTEVLIETTDGRTLMAHHDTGVPAEDLKEQGQRLHNKFTALAEPVLGKSRASELASAIDDVENLHDVRQLMMMVR